MRPPQAKPRTPQECSSLPRCPEVVAVARRRGITRVVHFTTVLGIVGILSSRAVKNRKQLPTEKHLEHVYRPNAIDRSRDAAWHEYVNLSVSRINDWMFDRSEPWHVDEGVSWVLLAFSVDILGDPGVVFTTTNNIYPACLRSQGIEGFAQMFADPVFGRYSQRHTRDGLPDSLTTDRQAEVLYPGELSLDRLEEIYVQIESAIGDVDGALGALGLDFPVTLAPEEFE